MVCEECSLELAGAAPRRCRLGRSSSRACSEVVACAGAEPAAGGARAGSRLRRARPHARNGRSPRCDWTALVRGRCRYRAGTDGGDLCHGQIPTRSAAHLRGPSLRTVMRPGASVGCDRVVTTLSAQLVAWCRTATAAGGLVQLAGLRPRAGTSTRRRESHEVVVGFEVPAGGLGERVVVAGPIGAPVLADQGGHDVDVVGAVAHGDPPHRLLVAVGSEPDLGDDLAGDVAPLLVGQVAGGRLIAGVVRVGDTVRRPATVASSFIASLLTHLAREGYEVSPRARQRRGRS